MLLLPIHTRRLEPGDDLAAVLAESEAPRAGDVVVISSKAAATVEGWFVDLGSLHPSPEAERLAGRTGRSAPFIEAVLLETERRNGTVIGSCPGALLTELSPEGLGAASILVANAGLDESNAPQGSAIGWPIDPVGTSSMLRCRLEERAGGGLAVLLTDSCVRPRRRGVVAFALAASGLDPLAPQQGRPDLYGNPLRITVEASADQLATAANFLMGNADQSTPAVLVRDHGLALSEFEGWVPTMPREEDLFSGLL